MLLERVEIIRWGGEVELTLSNRRIEGAWIVTPGEIFMVHLGGLRGSLT